MNNRFLMAGVCLAAAAAASGADKLNVKTGLWETTTVTNIDGSILPKELLDRLPPDKRAQIEQAMAAQGGTKAEPKITQTCLTQEELDKGVFAPPDSNCKSTVISSTPNHQEVSVQCSREGRVVNGHMVVDAPSSESIKGKMELKVADGKVIADFSGKWLGASCPAGAK
jgi:hypothetical protein